MSVEAAVRFEVPIRHDPEPSGVVRRSARVLLVVDDPDQQSRMAKHLRRRGLVVVGAPSLEAALAVADRWEADVALVEETLGGEGGADAVRRIRTVCPRARVLVLGRGEGTEQAALERLDAVLAAADPLVSEPVAIRPALLRLTLTAAE